MYVTQPSVKILLLSTYVFFKNYNIQRWFLVLSCSKESH